MRHYHVPSGWAGLGVCYFQKVSIITVHTFPKHACVIYWFAVVDKHMQAHVRKLCTRSKHDRGTFERYLLPTLLIHV
jgi:hypothetical protein